MITKVGPNENIGILLLNYSCYIIQMQVDTIALRISECIDDLGLILDQIYKFPQKQREQYFDKIQSMKNKLIVLKTNLRQNNAAATQKQYKQIYLAMNNFKNDISQQLTLMTVTKDNRQGKIKESKEAKKNYEESMRLIVEKEEEIGELKKILFEKEELIRINFEELRIIKQEFECVLEENRAIKFEKTSIQVQLESVRVSATSMEEELMELRMKNQGKDSAFLSAIDQLERQKGELLIANQKLSHFEKLADLSVKKTKIVEENIKKVERQAMDLNEHYKIKQNQNFKKMREIGELQFELNSKSQIVKQLQQQNKRFREDIIVLQNQIQTIHKRIKQQNQQISRDKQIMQQEKNKIIAQVEKGKRREKELTVIVEEAEKKLKQTMNRLVVAEQFKSQSQQLQMKNRSLQERIIKLELKLQENQKDKKIIFREKQLLSQQLERNLLANRQIEVEMYKLHQKLKIKQEEKNRLSGNIEMCQCKLRQYQKRITIQEVSEESLRKQLNQQKTKTIKIQQKYRVRDKEIQSLKIQLLRAKIQTIYEIRQVIS